MVELGKYNRLRIVKEVSFGFYLDGGTEYGEVLLPKQYIPEGKQPGDDIDIFLYRDSEDRPVACTLNPFAIVGDFAVLKVISVSMQGAFLDWGLPKDLLVPYREQKRPLQAGENCFVYIYQDQTSGRIVASTKIDKFINNTKPDYEDGESVDLQVYEKTSLGYNCIINSEHKGLLFYSEIGTDIPLGHKLKGFIREFRPDGKIDLSLQKKGFEKSTDIKEQLLTILEDTKGFLPLTDKSSSELIFKTTGMSKRNFKMAVGMLYKSQLIKITPEGITLIGD